MTQGNENFFKEFTQTMTPPEEIEAQLRKLEHSLQNQELGRELSRLSEEERIPIFNWLERFRLGQETQSELETITPQKDYSGDGVQYDNDCCTD